MRDSSGFSLVEVMIAALILVIGAGAAFSLIDSANRSVSFNSARVGATNLGRELAEYARTTDYDLLQPAQIVTALRKHPTITGTLSGGVWNIERRGITYTVSTSVCAYDDPKDGLGAVAPPNPCPKPAAVAGAPAEVNPDDYRRVTHTLSWNARGRPGKTTQAALIVNPAGGLGPRVTVFDEPPAQVSTGSVAWGATQILKLKTTTATSVHWTADDFVSGGNAGGGPTDWALDWSFGTEFSTTTPWVRDGTYTISAQAFDSRGVPGEAKLISVHVNRHAPAAVTGFDGGYNRSRDVVDLRWNRYDERDLKGYIVERVGGGVVCPLTDKLSCTDTNPPKVLGLFVAATYRLVAVDCLDLKAALCTTRDGAPATKSTSLIGAAAPSAPTGLTASVFDGKPTLSWTAPSGSVQFYRIYRDTGTNVADRYDETVTNSPNYVDPNPGSTTAHKYWVTAIDQNFNESPPSAPVVSPPIP